MLALVILLFSHAPVGAQPSNPANTAMNAEVSQNQAEPAITAFFSALQDVPVMEGMQELPDYTLVFDKPEGRIIETLAVYNTDSTADSETIRAFYQSALPQFGWHRVSRAVESGAQRDFFGRSGETLMIELDTASAGEVFVRFTLHPD
ncbi:MAG: hypothetical protein ACK4VI_03025 [Alphaproteobacteria bacterium]